MKESSDFESRKIGVRSKWSHAAAISAVLSIFFSLPLVVMALRFVAVLGRQGGALLGSASSMDFAMTAVVAIVAPLPLISGIATFGFLSVRSARSRRIAAICLLVSLLGMAILVITGMASAAEGKRTGGDTGMAQVIASVLVGVALPALISVPTILELVSLWRMKSTIRISEEE